MWGVYDGTCLRLTRNGDEIEELRLRVDVRHPDDDLLARALATARSLRLLIVTETGETIEPELAWVLNAAGRAPAAEFVRDSAGYLSAIASKLRKTDDDGTPE